jgi:signal transduction histidine kinase/pSer/pThr/pTyr-binding forkhead associated (FHA) protein
MTQAQICIVQGLNQDHEGRLYEVKETLVFGRSRKCDILIDDGLVSRAHAELQVREGGELWLKDLKSRNGTFVNQLRIDEVQLKPSDIFKVGRSEFVFVDPSYIPSTHLELVDDSQRSFVEPVIKKTLAMTPGHITDSFLVQPRRAEQGAESGSSSGDHGTRNAPQWFEVIFQINRELQTQSDPKEMSLAVSDLLLNVLDGDRCMIALFNEQEELELYSVRAADQKSYPYSVKISQTIAQQVTEERCALNINDLKQDKRFEESDSLLLSEIRSLLVAPIMIGNRVLGLIEVSRSDAIDAFSEAGLDLLSVVGSMIGAALNHAEQIRVKQAYIEELEATHEQLRLAQQDLVRTQQLAVIGRMASSINHEIGNLLMPLLEYHAMRSDSPEELTEDDLELFSPEELSYSCTQIKSLIEDIKYFSKGADRLPEMSRCDLADQVMKAVRFVKIDRETFPQLGPHKVQLITEISAHPKVIMDPLQVGRVIINLLRNAAQAMHGQEEPAQIEIRVKHEELKAIIEVSDNGPGVPEDVKAKLFEPFFTTKGEKGLGLGLDISRRIIHNHSGELAFEPRPTRGTTFRITLPVNPTLHELPEPARDAETPEATKNPAEDEAQLETYEFDLQTLAQESNPTPEPKAQVSGPSELSAPQKSADES